MSHSSSNISASLDLKINEEASSLLNNWLDELNLDQIVASKVDAVTGSKKPKKAPKSATTTKKTDSVSAKSRRDTTSGTGKRKSTNLVNADARLHKKNRSPSSPLPSSTTARQATNSALDDQYLVANMLSRNHTEIHNADLPSNIFIPQNNDDLEILQIVETNRQLKALSDIGNQENLSRKRIWRSAQSPTSPTYNHKPSRGHVASPHEDEDRSSNSELSFASNRSTSRPKSASSTTAVRRKPVINTSRRPNQAQQHSLAPDMMLMGRTLDTLSPPPADSPTAKKGIPKKNPQSKSRVFSSPTVLSRSLRQQAEKDGIELFEMNKLNPSLYVNNENNPLQRPSSSAGSTRRSVSRGGAGVPRSARLSTARSGKQSTSRVVTKRSTQQSTAPQISPSTPLESNFSDEDEIEDPEVLRIMNMTHNSELDFEDSMHRTSGEDSQLFTKRSHAALDDQFAYSSPPQQNSRVSESSPGLDMSHITTVSSPHQARAFSEDFERREAERLIRMRQLQERENQLRRMESERTFVDQTLFDASDIISADNPHINPRGGSSNTSSEQRPKSRDRSRGKSRRSISSRRHHTTAEPGQPVFTGRYVRQDHPEIARQRILYKDLYEGNADEDDIEREIEQKLRNMHQQLRSEREEKDKVTERLKQYELERKREELERIRQEKHRLQQEQEEKRLQLLNEKADELLATRDLRHKRRFFLLWKAKYLPQIRRLKDIQYQLAWKKKSRLFIAWRQYVEQQKESHYEQLLQRRMIIDQQRQDAADHFYRMRTLTKFLVRWQFMYKISKQRREIKKTSKLRQEKISSLLQRLQSNQETSPEPTISPQQATFATGSAVVVNAQTTPEPSTTTRTKRTPKKSRTASTSKKSTPLTSSHAIATPADAVPQAHDTTVLSSPTEVATPVETSTEPAPSQPAPQDASSSPQDDSNSKGDPMKHMMERQKARLEARKALQEKYKLLEEEKERQREEELKKQEELEKEQKRQILLEKKHQAELKKQKEEEREKRREEYRQKREMADLFRAKATLKYYGFIPWKRFMHMRRQDMDRALQHHDLVLRRHAFAQLRHAYQLAQERKEARVQQGSIKLQHFASNFLLNQCMTAWKEQNQERLDYYAEIDHLHSVRVLREALQHWRAVFRVVQAKRLKHEERQMEQAMHQSKKFTKKWYWILWRTYVRQERERKKEQQMTTALRSKVEGWLSDFRMQSDFDWDV